MRRWQGPLIVSVVYLGLWLALDALASVFQARQEVSLWYPPTGLSFALLLVFGLRYAPLLLLTDPLHGLVVSSPDVSWVSVLLGGVISTAVYTTVAWLLLRRLRLVGIVGLHDFSVRRVLGRTRLCRPAGRPTIGNPP